MSVGVFLILLSSFVNSAGNDFGLPGEVVLDEAELTLLLSGKTVKGVYIVQNKSFVRYYGNNGEVRQNVDQQIQEGNWFIDKKGQRCVIWSEKKQNCHVITKENEMYKEFLVQKKNKPKLMVIYKKVIVGNPEDL